MRTKFTYNKDSETIDQYMRTAEILHLMNVGVEVCMTEAAIKDVKNYIFDMALKEVQKEFDYMHLCQKDMHEDMPDIQEYIFETQKDIKEIKTQIINMNSQKEKWKERLIGFILGIAASAVATIIMGL